MKGIGIYIHIPFCQKKCPYCDFYSTVGSKNQIDDYTDAVLRAIAQYPFAEKGITHADTVYFGGGTPNLAGSKNIEKIIDAVDRKIGIREGEVSMEANPSPEFAAEIKDFVKAGINRLSVGIQSYSPKELEILSRKTSADYSRECVLKAHDAGIKSISADLMLAVPHQTRETLQGTMEYLWSLPISHVSAYMLKIEEGTAFHKNNYAELCPDEDETAQLYLDYVKGMEQHGFKQYEISNFAFSGHECRHNLKYWQQKEYLGIGPSAHSYIDNKRFAFLRDINSFIKEENPMQLAVVQDSGGDFEEYAMLVLRLKPGLDTKKAEKRFGINAKTLIKKAEILKKHGLVTVENGIITLTAEGFLISNAVTANLIF